MRHRRPGALAVLGMALAMALANGVPGVSGGAPPSRQWVDAQLREQLRRDAQVTIIGDVHESEAVVEEARAAEAAAGRPVTPVRKPYVRDYRKVAYRAAVKAGIRRPKLFVRQIAQESGFQPCARSYAGALGIAQIMPATARAWKVDPHMPEQALLVAAKKMAGYERKYGSYRLALAAYNAGPGAVRAYGGVPPYEETREYVRRITNTSYPIAGMDSKFRINPGMTPKMSKRLRALIRDVNRRGGSLHINDGWRSYEESVVIWKHTKRKYGGWRAAKQWAAPPGCSNHVRGTAADLRGSLRLAHRLAPRHGLVFPMSWEPWHVELRGIPTQSG